MYVEHCVSCDKVPFGYTTHTTNGESAGRGETHCGVRS